MTSVRTRWIATGLTTVAAAGVLAGCGSSDDDTSTAASSDAAATTTAADAGTTASTASGATSAGYKDGTYQAEGSYQSPGGTESIGVSVTLKGGTISAVTVTPKATDPNGKRFQGEFKDGIGAVVVGKSIDSLNVSKVAGSSLTSGGFNAALDTIKTDAKS
ncbi:hypothetical protein AB0L40_21670 [Patulibacter sp. NPDC049589]|uniref:FMN-binding protein n=1 Tax=Patulibacter sp. NPDC049589 TaxID=3154731 RepID=UPI00342E7551